MKKIEDRLKELQMDLNEEGEEINQNSLVSFLTICELIDDVILDNMRITLTPDNAIYANFSDDEYKYALYFKTDGNIQVAKLNL